MTDVVLEVDNIYKKFRKGELYDSLRDLIPAAVKGVFKTKQQRELEEREFWALQEVSFTLARGEAFGIIGSNGAGKSTILKLLSGIIFPTKGKINVSGRLSALIEVGAGFHPDLTGRENIYLNGTILGMSRKEIKSKFDDIVEFSGLEDFIDTPVKRYSSGMYARLGFSVAAHVEPDILIVDEVLSVGDYVFQTKCLERMNSIINGGASVIFVSHNLHAVGELCPRSLLLDHGRAVQIGPSQDVIKSYMDRSALQMREPHGNEIAISDVKVRDKNGNLNTDFSAGDRAWVDIEISANKDTEKVAVVFEVRDDSHYLIFDTSTEQLGYEAVSLKAGEKYRCTFQLDLHLAPGTYHIKLLVYRFDIQKKFDSWFPAATLFVRSDRDVRGVVNLYPEVVRQSRG
jgi:lipopolysaccharide transport system ATP-binding protein